MYSWSIKTLLIIKCWWTRVMHRIPRNIVIKNHLKNIFLLFVQSAGKTFATYLELLLDFVWATLYLIESRSIKFAGVFLFLWVFKFSRFAVYHYINICNQCHKSKNKRRRNAILQLRRNFTEPRIKLVLGFLKW